ncbi:PREDICTED: GTPase Era, mitochondrial [Drosophila arizonae]|uniref:GTPase Era, mitochondrial n=1 Tax=Drosophila arizonae TaxID=7263 RepID=A0ABM1PKG7_DROAR|nr:PREDICTED: GTPase Era, mitochondrial [Drosophila arizonae]
MHSYWLTNSLKLLKCNKNNLWITGVRRLSATTQSSGENIQSTTPPVQPTEELDNKNNNKEHKQRSLHIAVIGVPNVGKSTFINNIINHKVCPTSGKVHTTRKANTAILTTGQTQLVFYDTPGLVTQHEIRKHHLEQSFKSAYRHAIQHADIIAVMQDASNSWTRKSLHPTVIDTLKTYAQLPSLLVLNKVDALKSKRVLLDLIKTLTNDTLRSKSAIKKISLPSESVGVRLNQRETSWNHFSDVFLVSSITGSGLQELQDYLVDCAKPRRWVYPADVYTDETPETLIVESVRARLLDYLPQEIPYNLKCELEYYNVENRVVYTSVLVQCPTPRIERLICGESNGKLRQITERVTSDLVEMFGQAVSLTITTMSGGKRNS